MGLLRARARDHNGFRDLRQLPNLTDGWNEPPRRRDVPWGAAVLSLLGLTAAIVGARVLQGPPSSTGSPGITTATVAGAESLLGPTSDLGDPQSITPVPVTTSATATLVPVTPLVTPTAPSATSRSYASSPSSSTAVLPPVPSRSPSSPTSQVPAAGCSVTYGFDTVWSNGFVLNMTLTNTSSTTWNGWSGGFRLPAGVGVQSSWGANLQGSGWISMSNMSWDATVAPGASVKVGFQGVIPDPSAARISQISVQGSTCTVR